MAIRLRHLAHRSLAMLEKMMEAMGENVNVQTITRVDGKWYCFFLLGSQQMVEPLSKKDTIDKKIERGLKEMGEN